MDKISNNQLRQVVTRVEEQQSKVWECKKGVQGAYQGITFEYQGCGVIEPVFIRERSFRRSCACERDAQERYKRNQERREWQQVQAGHTYGWLGSSWSDASLTGKTFTNFVRDRQPEAYEVVQNFAEALSGTLILHGTYGTGKTHLLAALCNELRTRSEKPMSSLFVTAPKLFAAIQARIGFGEQYTSLISAAIRTNLLVIDDIDKAKHTDFREEVYFSILDARAIEGRPVAISTNRLADLATFVGGACASRLSIGQIDVEMIGDDFRREL